MNPLPPPTALHVARRLKDDHRGVTSIEYAMIALLIALVIVTSVTAIGTYLAPVFTTAANAI